MKEWITNEGVDARNKEGLVTYGRDIINGEKCLVGMVADSYEIPMNAFVPIDQVKKVEAEINEGKETEFEFQWSGNSNEEEGFIGPNTNGLKKLVSGLVVSGHGGTNNGSVQVQVEDLGTDGERNMEIIEEESASNNATSANKLSRKRILQICSRGKDLFGKAWKVTQA
ncbi:hypothetical protein SLE2022_058590 [Rubroshorea leprosula]